MKFSPGLRSYFLLMLAACLVPALVALAVIAVDAGTLLYAAIGIAAALLLSAAAWFLLSRLFEHAIGELHEYAKTLGNPSHPPRPAARRPADPGPGRAGPRADRGREPPRAGTGAAQRRRERAEAEQIDSGRCGAPGLDRQLGMGHRHRRHRLVGRHVPAVPADARSRCGLPNAPELSGLYARPA